MKERGRKRKSERDKYIWRERVKERKSERERERMSKLNIFRRCKEREKNESERERDGVE